MPESPGPFLPPVLRALLTVFLRIVYTSVSSSVYTVSKSYPYFGTSYR